jgi:hypothetical protein
MPGDPHKEAWSLALSQKLVNLLVHIANLDLHSKNKDQDQNGNQQNDGVHGNPPLQWLKGVS